MKQRRQKTMKSLILAVAVAAVVTPTAQARLDSERSQVTQSPATLNQSNDPAIRALMIRSEAMNRWYRQHSATPVIPDVFSRELTKAQSVASVVRHADDRAGVHGPGLVQTPQIVTSSGGGFDWSDASLGAGAALGIALILMSGYVLVRRNQGGHQVPA